MRVARASGPLVTMQLVGVNASDEELEELRKATVSGVKSVEADGRRVEYRTLAEQLQIVDQIEAQNGTKKRRRLVSFSRGYDK